jgi:transposase
LQFIPSFPIRPFLPKEVAMARPQSFPVRLTPEQRESLEQLRTQGLPRKQQYRSDILLRADEGDTDREIADDLGVHAGTVRRVRRRFAEHGLDAALTDRPRPGAPPKLDGKQEAMVIALACTGAPQGRDRWSVRLLARRAVELEVVETVSRETVRRVLKKMP